MSGDESEEKTLQASKRKLKKQREKGAVVTSKETVMSFVGIAAILYLYTTRFRTGEKFAALWELEPSYDGQAFAQQLQSKVAIVMQLGIELVLPLLGLVIGVAVLTSMLISGGPVFSLDPIAPSFEKISPASGFKKIFSRKALMSFLMHLIRLLVLASVFGLILLTGWQALILAPVCGIGCAMDTLDGVMLPMVIGAIAVMSITAVFDYLVQQADFMREQKMTMTEYKREMKDQMGDPHLRGQMKQERRQMLTAPTGPGRATLMVTSGSSVSVGLRYVQGETPAPLVVARVRGRPAIRSMARKSNAYEHRDPELVKLLSRSAVGSYITDDELISQIAPLIQRASRLR